MEGKDASVSMHECMGATCVHTHIHTEIKFSKERENQKNTEGWDSGEPGRNEVGLDSMAVSLLPQLAIFVPF